MKEILREVNALITEIHRILRERRCNAGKPAGCRKGGQAVCRREKGLLGQTGGSLCKTSGKTFILQSEITDVE